jgi:hypothetical protein
MENIIRVELEFKTNGRINATAFAEAVANTVASALSDLAPEDVEIELTASDSEVEQST